MTDKEILDMLENALKHYEEWNAQDDMIDEYDALREFKCPEKHIHTFYYMMKHINLDELRAIRAN